MSDAAWLNELLEKTATQQRPASSREADRETFQAFLGGGGKTSGALLSTPSARPSSRAASPASATAAARSLRGLSPATLGRSVIEAGSHPKTPLSAASMAELPREGLIRELELCQQELKSSRKCTAQAMEAWRHSETGRREAQEASIAVTGHEQELANAARQETERAEVPPSTHPPANPEGSPS